MKNVGHIFLLQSEFYTAGQPAGVRHCCALLWILVPCPAMLASMLAASALCMLTLLYLQPGRPQPQRIIYCGMQEADRGSLKTVTVLWRHLVDWGPMWHRRGQLLVQSPKVVRAVAGPQAKLAVFSGVHDRWSPVQDNLVVCIECRVRNVVRAAPGGGFETASVLAASWGADHRVVDGATLAHFSNAWKALLEEPRRLLLHLR